MPRKKPTDPPREKHAGDTHTIEDHAVEIRGKEGKEELRIDGVRQRFFVTQAGYTLHADA